MTTILTMPYQDHCITLPINAYKSLNVFTPTMEKASNMARSTFGRPSLIVAFALQMGVVMYWLQGKPETPNSALYQRCDRFYLTDYSQASFTLPASEYAQSHY
ncbi:uncharacterized protein LOC119375637 [Rhipicephalus sanguineus]|uniref:uncharacterized protein LOC119375637 n=1 Tax=Rhipicephalus sanguineus TaxID=34632 RepID=UPI0020C32FBE|nr:uncharacterized protein LOC119375637 [Rhipicephalus sanguineus]